jgi:hypothetical protein
MGYYCSLATLWKHGSFTCEGCPLGILGKGCPEWLLNRVISYALVCDLLQIDCC